MKISSILVAALILSLLSLSEAGNTDCNGASERSDQKITVLTFYVEQQAEQAEDFIEMGLTILQKDNSLKKALDKVKSRTASIREVATKYCNNNGGEDCENCMEVGKNQIAPIYQTIRREPIFSGFSVTQEATMQVKNTENIGELVDSILSIGVHQIDKFQWKPEVEADAEEIAIDQGISQARDLCHHINRQIGEILAIEQVFNEEDEEGQQEEGDQEEQDEQDPSILKFVVECVPKNGEEPDFTPEDLQVAKQEVKEEPAPETKEKKKKKKKKE